VKALLTFDMDAEKSASISSVRALKRWMEGLLKIESEMASSKTLAAWERMRSSDAGERNVVLRRSHGEPPPPLAAVGVEPKNWREPRLTLDMRDESCPGSMALDLGELLGEVRFSAVGGAPPSAGSLSTATLAGGNCRFESDARDPPHDDEAPISDQR